MSTNQLTGIFLAFLLILAVLSKWEPQTGKNQKRESAMKVDMNNFLSFCDSSTIRWETEMLGRSDNPKMTITCSLNNGSVHLASDDWKVK